MKILITGGAGFIGTNIAIAARARGYQVTVMDSLVRKGVEFNIPILEQHGVTVFRGDVRNRDDFSRLEGFFDRIIHLAGNPGIPWSISYPWYDFNVNAGGTLGVLEYAKQNGNIPVIYASTNKCYSDLVNEIPIKKEETRYAWDQPKDGWMEGVTLKGIGEHFPTDGFQRYPHSPYGVSKLAGDNYCLEYFHTYGLPVVVNRMSCIYGFYQKGVADQGWIDHFIREIGFGKGKIDIFGDGKQVRDMCFGTNLADLYLYEAENVDSLQGNIFNVGGGVDNTLSLNEAIAYIEEITGKKAIIEYHDWRHADQRIYISDITKVSNKTGWKPRTTPQEGIELIYERYKKFGL